MRQTSHRLPLPNLPLRKLSFFLSPLPKNLLYTSLNTAICTPMLINLTDTDHFRMCSHPHPRLSSSRKEGRKDQAANSLRRDKPYLPILPNVYHRPNTRRPHF